MSEDKTLEEELAEESDDEILDNKYLMCRLGNESYGIDIRFVTDIIELPNITDVPDMPDYVKGVINLRGQVIPVIDMRLRFGMEAREYDGRTVITVVNIHDASIGFIVDTATEVNDISEKNIDPPPSFNEGGEKNRYIAGLGKIDDQVVILLDVENLIGQEDMGTLQSEKN